jgi:KaiC/GvpD/RAD55 family RecA-like ATPase
MDFGGHMKKLRTGVPGLDPLLNGGFNEHTVDLIIGSMGTGKTTMAMQFLREGLEVGEEAIYISTEEPIHQIVSAAEELGWSNIRRHIDNGDLVIIQATGESFVKFIKEELLAFTLKWGEEGRKSKIRIVIDTFTPVLWTLAHKYEQRETTSFLFKELKKVGTILVTLEEYARGDRMSEENKIPLFLADSVVRLDYDVGLPQHTRTLRILKCRNSEHSEMLHPYQIVAGVGLSVLEAGRNSGRLVGHLHKFSGGDGMEKTIHHIFQKEKDSENNSGGLLPTTPSYQKHAPVVSSLLPTLSPDTKRDVVMNDEVKKAIGQLLEKKCTTNEFIQMLPILPSNDNEHDDRHPRLETKEKGNSEKIENKSFFSKNLIE